MVDLWSAWPSTLRSLALLKRRRGTARTGLLSHPGMHHCLPSEKDRLNTTLIFSTVAGLYPSSALPDAATLPLLRVVGGEEVFVEMHERIVARGELAEVAEQRMWVAGAHQLHQIIDDIPLNF